MKIAIVTGAYKGLGLEWCNQLAHLGYKVVLTARDLEKANAAAHELNEQELVVYPKELNVTNETEIAQLVSWCSEYFGKVDVIINNAGINPKDFPDKEKMAKAFRLEAFDPLVMDEVIHINSYAPLLMVKHFRHLLAKSQQPIVINISSWLGSVSQLGFGGHYGYVGSKNLLNVLNKSMALELKPEGIITVNVNPGWVQTDMGGSKAQFTVQQAVKQLIENVLDKVTINDSGKFLNYDGTEHPW